jgi:hypothetical protein
MVIKLPLTLLFNQTQIAVISSYGYETPWACGSIEPKDSDLQHRFIQVCEYLNELEKMPEELLEDDLAGKQELTKRGITNDDVEIYFNSDWAIATQSGELYPIAPPEFDHNGFLTWRW